MAVAVIYSLESTMSILSDVIHNINALMIFFHSLQTDLPFLLMFLYMVPNFIVIIPYSSKFKIISIENFQSFNHIKTS